MKNGPRCDGTGTLTYYSPNARELVCFVCGQVVPVDSDEKRTWFLAHDKPEEKGTS